MEITDEKTNKKKTVPKTQLNAIGGRDYYYCKLVISLKGTRYPATGSNKDRILHFASVIHNGHTFWAPNIGGTLNLSDGTVTYPNEGYDWKYLYQ